MTDLSLYFSARRHRFFLLLLLLFLLLTCLPSTCLSVIVHRCLADSVSTFSSAVHYLYDFERAALILIAEVS